MTFAVEAAKLTKTFDSGSRAALEGVTLHVSAGERVLLTGPSGSGKSTLINLIGCLDRPSSGLLSVGGVAVEKLGEHRLAQIRRSIVGIVFQHHFLPTGLTAEEVVAAPLLWSRNLSAGEALDEARELLNDLDLSAAECARPVQNLSGGQRQRVAFARAVAPGPAILLADEPTAQLDHATARLLLDQMMDWSAGEGKTLIVASHHHLDEWSGGRTISLRDGRLQTSS